MNRGNGKNSLHSSRSIFLVHINFSHFGRTLLSWLLSLCRANGLLTNFLTKFSAEDSMSSRPWWGHGELWDGGLLAKGIKRLDTSNHRSAGSCKGREQLCVKKSRMVHQFKHPCRTQEKDSLLHCKFLGWNWVCSLLSQTHISWKCVSFPLISTRFLRSCWSELQLTHL